MNPVTQEPLPLGELLEKMLQAKQLSTTDAQELAGRQARGESAPVKSEEDVLRWLAKEYGLSYTSLEDIQPDKEVLSLFPARILLKDELLPLRRINGCVEVATSRLFATQALDTLKTMTGLRLNPVLAPSEAIQREMKKRLGVGADTIGTLDEEVPFQVVDEAREDDANLETAAEDASIIRFVNQVLRRLKTNCGFATGLMVSCRRFPCRHRSSGSSQPSFHVSRS
jgi:hypothetical protein